MSYIVLMNVCGNTCVEGVEISREELGVSLMEEFDVDVYEVRKLTEVEKRLAQLENLVKISEEIAIEITKAAQK